MFLNVFYYSFVVGDVFAQALQMVLYLVGTDRWRCRRTRGSDEWYAAIENIGDRLARMAQWRDVILRSPPTPISPKSDVAFERCQRHRTKHLNDEVLPVFLEVSRQRPKFRAWLGIIGNAEKHLPEHISRERPPGFLVKVSASGWAYRLRSDLHPLNATCLTSSVGSLVRKRRYCFDG